MILTTASSEKTTKKTNSSCSWITSKKTYYWLVLKSRATGIANDSARNVSNWMSPFLLWKHEFVGVDKIIIYFWIQSTRRWRADDHIQRGQIKSFVICWFKGVKFDLKRIGTKTGRKIQCISEAWLEEVKGALSKLRRVCSYEREDCVLVMTIALPYAQQVAAMARYRETHSDVLIYYCKKDNSCWVNGQS